MATATAPDQDLAIRAEKYERDLCSGRPDPALMEDVWHEVERILELGNRQERRDAIEDTTLSDIIGRVAEARARAE